MLMFSDKKKKKTNRVIQVHRHDFDQMNQISIESWDEFLDHTVEPIFFSPH